MLRLYFNKNTDLEPAQIFQTNYLKVRSCNLLHILIEPKQHRKNLGPRTSSQQLPVI